MYIFFTWNLKTNHIMYSSLIPNAKIAMIQFGSSILNDVEATSTAVFFVFCWRWWWCWICPINLSRSLTKCLEVKRDDVWWQVLDKYDPNTLAQWPSPNLENWPVEAWTFCYILIESGCSRRRNRAWKLMGSLGDRKTWPIFLGNMFDRLALGTKWRWSFSDLTPTTGGWACRLLCGSNLSTFHVYQVDVYRCEMMWDLLACETQEAEPARRLASRPRGNISWMHVFFCWINLGEQAGKDCRVRKFRDVPLCFIKFKL